MAHASFKEMWLAAALCTVSVQGAYLIGIDTDATAETPGLVAQLRHRGRGRGQKQETRDQSAPSEFVHDLSPWLAAIGLE